ncbi:capsid cement protein [Rhizobacter sp. P5_C2]
MKNFIQHGQSLTHTPAAAVAAGGAAKIGSRIGIAVSNVAAGAPGTFTAEGVYRLPKLAADAVGQGDSVRWDHLQGVITVATTGAGNVALASAGYAFNAAAAGEAFVDVKVNA